MRIYSVKIPGLLLLFFLAACAVPKEDPLTAVREQAVTLPGAIVSADGAQISYPGDVLFAEGSVLPLPGGMDVLEPLIDLLLNSPELAVVGTVRSSGHDPDYDRLLAAKRLDVLSRIFLNRGVAETRLQMTATAGEGPPLGLRLQPFSATTSSAVKQ